MLRTGITTASQHDWTVRCLTACNSYGIPNCIPFGPIHRHLVCSSRYKAEPRLGCTSKRYFNTNATGDMNAKGMKMLVVMVVIVILGQYGSSFIAVVVVGGGGGSGGGRVVEGNMLLQFC